MLDEGIYIVKKLNEAGFSSYIVGGAVRDFILNINTNDMDICTSATPVQICKIFKNCELTNLGNVYIKYKSNRFEITTFREEFNYINHRRPTKINYVLDVRKDLNRRDFTINTMLIDENHTIIDYLGGKRDLDNKIIRTVGDARVRFYEDSLRILRAIRFATKLGFSLDNNVLDGISLNKKYLKELSYERKREELDKIFLSDNYLYGIKLLIDLGLDKELEINNLKKIDKQYDILGIWAILEVDDKYSFTNVEKDTLKKIREAVNSDLNDFDLYKYGLYVSKVAASIKGINIDDILDRYNRLPIKSRGDILVDGVDIMSVMGMDEGKYIDDIFNVLENEIINNKLNNNKDDIIRFIKIYYL